MSDNETIGMPPYIPSDVPPDVQDLILKDFQKCERRRLLKNKVDKARRITDPAPVHHDTTDIYQAEDVFERHVRNPLPNRRLNEKMDVHLYYADNMRVFLNGGVDKHILVPSNYKQFCATPDEYITKAKAKMPEIAIVQEALANEEAIIQAYQQLMAEQDAEPAKHSAEIAELQDMRKQATEKAVANDNKIKEILRKHQTTPLSNQETKTLVTSVWANMQLQKTYDTAQSQLQTFQPNDIITSEFPPSWCYRLPDFAQFALNKLQQEIWSLADLDKALPTEASMLPIEQPTEPQHWWQKRKSEVT